MANPFVEITAFTTEFGGALTAAQTSQATRLLQVVSDRIRELNPDVDPLAAAQVVFEVVRDAVLYGHLDRFASFQNTTSRRTEAGTVDADRSAVDDYLTRRHKVLLGIALVAEPMGHFPENDY
ncbi:hypothetical protein [Mycobacteroides abscessus]|uniref:Head-to-tail adaptor n=1 Tax=Mycobacteroides abscessus subsp. massiliense TaxID=1962118 RepID=A0A1U1IE29_9MYCO|nr:hypothetical protein [Mycobacteroides abscessus]QSM03434.1 head-to-tail adaptor [Mycobacterium phage prophi62-2]EIC70366.1 hypothetical protein S7W_05608 [Mycobacteroides abscessus M94]MBN7455275.1 hypothetical protein [Mycobacteroides abscessus subsp. abscessus]SIJ31074.1 Uncharacterised protein [Mycobacteroides abscessus subsp. abscessus]SIJ52442.1 Uncharacterised protein [Mycobacteroides abscessus subsp. bolletii]